jgi:uncharacterized protein YunC (DUF1805 family)
LLAVECLRVDGFSFLGVRVDVPDGPPMLLIIAEKGFVMCGFLNLDAAEKLGVAAAVVSGVRTLEDVLNAEIKDVTKKAKEYGVKVGMKGVEALKLMK